MAVKQDHGCFCFHYHRAIGNASQHPRSACASQDPLSNLWIIFDIRADLLCNWAKMGQGCDATRTLRMIIQDSQDSPDFQGKVVSFFYWRSNNMCGVVLSLCFDNLWVSILFPCINHHHDTPKEWSNARIQRIEASVDLFALISFLLL